MKISVNNIVHNVYLSKVCGRVYVDLLGQQAVSAQSVEALVEKLLSYGFKVQVY